MDSRMLGGMLIILIISFSFKNYFNAFNGIKIACCKLIGTKLNIVLTGSKCVLYELDIN